MFKEKSSRAFFSSSWENDFSKKAELQEILEVRKDKHLGPLWKSEGTCFIVSSLHKPFFTPLWSICSFHYTQVTVF
jgi:hypothetical protein